MSDTTDFYAQPGEETQGTVYTAMGGDWAHIATEQAERSDEILVINMGPQHPSTHGVLRLILECDGETVLSIRPGIGFLHTGKALSFVYDIADLWKLDTVVPEAFRIAGLAQKGSLQMPPERAVRQACRDVFRRSGLLARIIPQIEEVLAAGELPKPLPPPEAAGPAFADPEEGP